MLADTEMFWWQHLAAQVSQEWKRLFLCRVYLGCLPGSLQESAVRWIWRKEVMRGIFCFFAYNLLSESRHMMLSCLITCQLLNVWVYGFVIQTGERVSLMHIYYHEFHCETHSTVGLISFELIWHKIKKVRILSCFNHTAPPSNPYRWIERYSGRPEHTIDKP